MQEVDDLHQTFLGLILTGHVGKGDAGGLFHVDLGVGFAHIADAAEPAAAALGDQAEEEHEDGHHQDAGKDVTHHQFHDEGRFGDVGVEIVHIVFDEEGGEIVIGDGHGEERVVLAEHLALFIGVDIALLGGDIEHAVFAADLGDMALLHQIDKLGIVDLVLAGSGIFVIDIVAQILQGDGDDQGPGDQGKKAVGILFVFITPVVGIIFLFIIIHAKLLI